MVPFQQRLRCQEQRIYLGDERVRIPDAVLVLLKPFNVILELSPVADDILILAETVDGDLIDAQKHILYTCRIAGKQLRVDKTAGVDEPGDLLVLWNVALSLQRSVYLPEVLLHGAQLAVYTVQIDDLLRLLKEFKPISLRIDAEYTGVAHHINRRPGHVQRSVLDKFLMVFFFGLAAGEMDEFVLIYAGSEITGKFLPEHCICEIYGVIPHFRKVGLILSLSGNGWRARGKNDRDRRLSPERRGVLFGKQPGYQLQYKVAGDVISAQASGGFLRIEPDIPVPNDILNMVALNDKIYGNLW